jgi:hypothetical protein
MIEELLLISNTLKLLIYLLYTLFFKKKAQLPRTDKEDIPAQSLSGLGRGDSRGGGTGRRVVCMGLWGGVGWGGGDHWMHCMWFNLWGLKCPRMRGPVFLDSHTPSMLYLSMQRLFLLDVIT